jgi:heavy metal translocating P-type ATPase
LIMMSVKLKNNWRLLVSGGLGLCAWLFELSGSVYKDQAAVLALATVFLAGYPLVGNAWRSIRRWRLNMDALVVIAASAALALGEWLEAATVVFILFLGEELEELTVNKARSAISWLMELVPDEVSLIKNDKEIRLSPDQVKVGDILIIRPGERVAVDGVVVSGTTSLDESTITGEPWPVNKTQGDEVCSGSLNLSGAVKLRATRVGEHSTMSKIRQMMEQAKGKKAPLQRLVDRFSQWFVPGILIAAIIIYLINQDINRAITVLIVACPCALVLGTPMAVVASISSAARKGVLVKGGAVLEAMGNLNSMVFDKTGTLTYGRPEVVEVKNFCGLACSQEDTLTFAAIAENLSEHPLAGAILQKAEEWELVISTPDDFALQQGQGVLARHEGINIVLGNRGLLKENNITLTQEMEDYIRSREAQGETAVIVAHHTQVCGVISLSDTLRHNAFYTMHQLRTLGINRILAMYTGDNYETALVIARKLKIDEFAANLLPHQKVKQVQALKDRGFNVGMVGDGVNDAPALATAHVGIAMGVVGSDIAVEAADVALMTDNLSRIPQIIDLSRHTIRVIRQNLWFAILFNFSLIAIASQGYISMIAGAVLHQLSSLAVILNSMRLLLYFNPNDSGLIEGNSELIENI